jgi:uncharacterized protein YutE (UPF0331/DUF86 family)
MKIHKSRRIHSCGEGCSHNCNHTHRHPLHEGTKYDKKAATKLASSGLFDEETSKKIVDALFREDIHAFVHSPSWLEKYLIGIVNMLIKYCDGDRTKAQEFLANSIGNFDEYLTYIKELRPTLPQEKQLELDKTFNEQMSYEDMVKELEELHRTRDEESAEKLKNANFDGESDFELIPIDSYEQMNQMFGGAATGDGSSDKYAGGGGTAWCHTNSEYTYKSWVQDGKQKFFVLAHKNWKDIPFDKDSNSANPKDDYGNSLIALLVNTKTGSLRYATLRCNHVGTTDADHQYKTYAELSEVAGFNVAEAVKAHLNISSDSEEDELECYECGDFYPEDEMMEGPDGEMYCDTCWGDKFFTCEDCGSIYDQDEMNWLGDSVYCDYCLGRHGTRCYECGDVTSWDELIESPDGDWYCDWCAGRADFDRCSNCGDTYWTEDMIYAEDDGYICQDCFDSDYFQCINCDSIYEDRYANRSDDGPVCDNCIEGGDYFICDDCGNAFEQDEANVTDDGYVYCPSCYEAMMEEDEEDS